MSILSNTRQRITAVSSGIAYCREHKDAKFEIFRNCFVAQCEGYRLTVSRMSANEVEVTVDFFNRETGPVTYTSPNNWILFLDYLFAELEPFERVCRFTNVYGWSWLMAQLEEKESVLKMRQQIARELNLGLSFLTRNMDIESSTVADVNEKILEVRSLISDTTAEVDILNGLLAKFDN